MGVFFISGIPEYRKKPREILNGISIHKGIQNFFVTDSDIPIDV